ncbi:calexcitin-2-like [Babylonia areolata]|uniref:calexcitin-2-like n=1 Tax=Babylonia areolata TaxID=304850 RepID=UPI003FD45B82
MSLSGFLEKKLKYVYANLYDSNRDGIIDQEDFNDILQKVGTIHHWGKNAESFEKAKKLLDVVWEGLRSEADTNKDGKVTQQEWLDMWKRTLTNVKAGKEFPKWQESYIEFTFFANDANGDGMIDEEEFIDIQSLLGHSADDSKTAFKELLKESASEGNMISKEKFHDLWKDFFMSEEEGKPGNNLFVKTDFS